MTRTKVVWTASLAVVTVLLLAGCGGFSTQAGAANADGKGTAWSLGLTTYPVDQRVPLPAVSGTTLAGSRLDLTSLRGHVIVLNVWASWCTQCRTESPALAHLAASPALKQVRFVGIDEQDQPSAARSFSAKVGTTYPHLVDRNGSLLAKLPMVPTTAVPSTLVVDAQGRVAARVIGGINQASLLRELRSLLAGSTDGG